MASNPYAFPQPVTAANGAIYMPCENHEDFAGMMLRDYFAAHALNGLIVQQSSANALKALLGSDEAVYAAMARVAFSYADAMRAEREKGGA